MTTPILDVKLPRCLIRSRRFETAYCCLFQGVKQSKKNDCLTLEDGSDMLSWSVCKQLPNYTEQYVRRWEISRKQRLDTFCSIDLHMTMLRGGGGGRGGWRGGRGAGAGGEVEKYKSFWIQFEVIYSKFLPWKSVQHLTIEDDALFPYLVPASHKTHCVLVTRTSHLILFREINIYIFCESYDRFQLSCG